MPQYMVAIQLPDDFDPSSVDKATERAIDELNEEIVAAGIGVFVGGLRRAKQSRCAGGKVLVTDGPYLETKEHIGGFWIIEAADMDQAVACARKGVVACQAPVEVRPFGSQAQARLERLKETQ